MDTSKLIDGIKVGDYFVTFPPGDIVQEDKDGNVFVKVDIFKIEKDKTIPIEGNISPELEQAIGEEIARILDAAMEAEEKNNINK